jgi:hypothetical protein
VSRVNCPTFTINKYDQFQIKMLYISTTNKQIEEPNVCITFIHNYKHSLTLLLSVFYLVIHVCTVCVLSCHSCLYGLCFILSFMFVRSVFYLVIHVCDLTLLLYGLCFIIHVCDSVCSFWVEASLCRFLIVCLYLYCRWRSTYAEGRVGIPLTGLTLQHC